MSAQSTEVWIFVVEWYDNMPQLKRKYNLKYFPSSHSVEMIDLNTKKVFLKKSPLSPEISTNEFVIGGKIVIYSRELDIVDYGDSHTRQLLQHQMQQTLVILPFSATRRWGALLSELEKRDLNILKLKSVIVTEILTDQIAMELQDNKLDDILASGMLALFVLVQGEDGIRKVELVRSEAANKWGAEIITTDNELATGNIVDLVYNSNRISTATYDSATCCIIKPHALKEKLCGNVFQMIISAGFEISAVESLYFDRQKSDEFLEVYKGVIPDYTEQSVQLSSGLCVALELRGQDAVSMFRMLAGPWDVDIARELFPESIRGRLGHDKVRSVVHCTDLEEDAKLEVQYCFRIMV